MRHRVTRTLLRRGADRVVDPDTRTARPVEPDSLAGFPGTI
ncbi:MAG: hypothetical protein ACR2NV_06600 [Thermoleophilaceae bacterium]